MSNLVKKEYENIEDMPKDIYIEEKKQTDEELLNALLSVDDVVTKEIYMRRFKANFVIQSISSDEYNKLEKQCKYPVKNTRTHQLEEKVDNDKLAKLLILKACIKPDWNNKKLLDKYGTTDPLQVIPKRLLLGEISELNSAIMDISGFHDGFEEIKN